MIALMAAQFFPPWDRPKLSDLWTADRLAWLNVSGPRYKAADFTLKAVDMDATLIDASGKIVRLGPSEMSFASWQTVLTAPLESVVSLMIRIDPVGAP